MAQVALLKRSTVANLLLFASGIFFGGALDHVILALQGQTRTHYGLHVPVLAQWAFAAFDLSVSAVLWFVHRRAREGSER